MCRDAAKFNTLANELSVCGSIWTQAGEDTEHSDVPDDVFHHDILVMTPSVSLSCAPDLMYDTLTKWKQFFQLFLRNSRISFSDIQSMVLIDTHCVSAIGNGSEIFTIGDEFYHAEASARPRIFVIVNPHNFARHNIARLEILFSAVAIGSHTDIGENCDDAALADPIIVPFEVLRLEIPETCILGKLNSQSMSETWLMRIYHLSWHVFREIGPLSSDLLWKRNIPFMRRRVKHLKRFHPTDTRWQLAQTVVDTVVEHMVTTSTCIPTESNKNLSLKVVKLVEVIQSFRAYGLDFRGVVLG
jgi:hypothetical protein